MDGGLGWLYKTAGMQHIPLVIHHSLTHPLIFAPHIHTDVILCLISNLAIPTQHTFWPGLFLSVFCVRMDDLNKIKKLLLINILIMLTLSMQKQYTKLIVHAGSAFTWGSESVGPRAGGSGVGVGSGS